MDRHVRWLRRRIVPRVLLRLTVEWIAVADIILLGLLLTGSDPLLALSWALLGGILWVIVRVGVAMVANPVNARFLTRYIDEPLHVQPMASNPDDEHDFGDAGPFLERHNLDHVVDLRSHDSFVSVHTSPDGRVLALLGPGENVPTFVSLLSDGRILVTSNQLVVPHESLIVNHDRRRDARWLVEHHVDVLEELHDSGASPMPADHGAAAQLLLIEHEAWAQLGPFLGPFLNIGTRYAPHLLTIKVPPALMLERTRVPGSIALPAATEQPVGAIPTSPQATSEPLAVVRPLNQLDVEDDTGSSLAA